MRTIHININGRLQMQLRGTEAWSNPGDAILCAHDVFHHLPFDDGSIVGELMSFGAQLWLERDAQGYACITGDELACALDQTWTSCQAPSRFFVPDVPFNFRQPPQACLDAFDRVIEEGLMDFALMLTRSLKGKPATVDLDLVMAGMPSNRVRDWMAAGYRIAQRRFPDPGVGQTLSHKLCRLLDDAASRGCTLLSIEVDENEGNLVVVNEERPRLAA